MADTERHLMAASIESATLIKRLINHGGERPFTCRWMVGHSLDIQANGHYSNSNEKWPIPVTTVRKAAMQGGPGGYWW